MSVIHSSNFKLSTGLTVSKYRELEVTRDRAAIARHLKTRFIERYLTPIVVDKNVKSGFAIIAISCLMIESLETFRLGWENSKNRSKQVFISFFKQWPSFQVFQEGAEEFYEHVRCGILHQAETTAGWRIHRVGPLIDYKNRTINAIKFHRELGIVLEKYFDQLEAEPWDSDCWKAFRKKMDAICRNCEAPN